MRLSTWAVAGPYRTRPGASRDELYADFVKDLCSTLAHRGLQPMLWADIALENPHTMDLLPGDHHDAQLDV